MMIATFVLWVSTPLVPVTESVNVPAVAEESALTVSVEVAVPPRGGVTGPGRDMETPEGAAPIHEYARVTAELNPFDEPILILDVADPP
jgi:hypothetical protein